MKQIEAGGPVTITHRDMTRYFMLIPEAVQLVLQAAALGGQGTVYVLDMGKPVRMLDVAQDLIRLHGLTPEKDIRIQITGTRPGEKLFEELLVSDVQQSPSSRPKIFFERHQELPQDLDGLVGSLLTAAEAHDGPGIRQALQALAPDVRLGQEERVAPVTRASVPSS